MSDGWAFGTCVLSDELRFDLNFYSVIKAWEFSGSGSSGNICCICRLRTLNECHSYAVCFEPVAAGSVAKLES